MSRVSLLCRIISIVILWVVLFSIGIAHGDKATIRQFYPIGCFSKNLNNALSQADPSLKVTILGPPVENQSIIDQCAATCKGFFEGYDYVLAIQQQVCMCLTLFFGGVQLYSIPDDCCNLKTADNISATIGGNNAFNVFCEEKECGSRFENTTFSKETASCTGFNKFNQNFDNPRSSATTKLLQVPYFQNAKLIPCISNNCTFRFDKNGQLCQNFEIETEGDISNQSSPVIQFAAEYIPKVDNDPKLCMEYCTNGGSKTFQYIDSHFKYAMVSTVFIENIGFFGLCQCSNDLAIFEERNIKICENCHDYGFENETTICDSSYSNITNTVYTYCNLSDTTECLGETYQKFRETPSETESTQKWKFSWFQFSYALLMLPILLVHNSFVFVCIAIVLFFVSLVLLSLFALVKLLCNCNEYESILGLDDRMENTMTYSPADSEVDKVFHTYAKNLEDKI